MSKHDLTVKLSYEERIINALAHVERKRGEHFTVTQVKEMEAIRAALRPLYEEATALRTIAAQLADALAKQVTLSDHDPIERLDNIRGASYRALETWEAWRG